MTKTSGIAEEACAAKRDVIAGDRAPMTDAPRPFGLRDAGAAMGDALRFFTRLPVPAGWTARDPALIFDGAAAAAPFAGLLVGAGAGAALAAGVALGLPAMAGGALAAGVAVALTGALHQDGLADVADALGGATRERKLAIMRDSGVGAYGASALALALIARVALAAGVAERLDGAAVLLPLAAAAALGRPLAFLATILLAPARADGAGRMARPRTVSVAIGCGLGAAAAVVLAGPGPGVIAALSASGAALATVALARRQVGGYTGDHCGAASEAAEIAALAALCALLP